MTRTLGWSALVFVVALAHARADAPNELPAETSPAPAAHRVTHNALVLYPASFAERGVMVGYERALANPRLAVLGRFSFAAPLSGDFRSRGTGVGVEGRWYFLGRGPFTRYAGPAPVGPYLGARVHLTTTTLVERATQRRVGSSERLAIELAAGCRFTIVGAIELSPFVGFVLYSDFVDNMAPTLLPSVAFGASVGGMFERR
jgi:hypothetical protein